MEQEENISIPNYKQFTDQLVKIYDGTETPPEEVVLSIALSLILYETDIIEPFNNIPYVHDTYFDVVKQKMKYIQSTDQTGWFPDSSTSEYPIKFDFETLDRAPWVNMVHAWGIVFNELNTVRAMQKGETPKSPEVIAAIANTLYKFTTNSDGDQFNRKDEDFLAGKKFVETVRKESGTQGVNPLRHVCLEEMKFILSSFYAKHRKKDLFEDYLRGLSEK